MVGLVASLGGRLTAVSVNALNGRHFREQANAGVSHGIHQQPWNGVGILGVHVGGGFTRNFAAVFQFPGGTGEMASDDVALLIFQLGLGCYEGPTELYRAGPTGINLRSGGTGE